MEYLAKITGEQNFKNLLKYDFVDLSTGKEDFFYHSQKLNYISILAGRLKLLWDEERKTKFFQSFEQDINSYVEGSRAEKLLTRIWGKSSQIIRKLESEKIKLSLQQIIELEQRGLTHKQIAKVACCCERTVGRWKNPSIKPKQKRGRKRIMNEEIRAFLYLDFLNNNTKTQRERAAAIYREKGIKVSQQVISYNVRKDTNFTRKKGAKRYSRLDLKKVKQFLKENYHLYSSPRCLAVDEFSTHLGEAPRYAWSRAGCLAEIIQTGQKITTYTVMIWVRNTNHGERIGYKVIKKSKGNKGTGAKDFYDFLESINLSEKLYLLLDNARIHSAPRKRKELGLPTIEEQATQKNMILIYLPPYAPQINPAELCIHFIRTGHLERKQPRNEEELLMIIQEAANLLSQLDLTKFFRHCRDFFGFKSGH